MDKHGCPICEKDLTINLNSYWTTECKNGCYKMSFDKGTIVSVFGEEIKMKWTTAKLTDEEIEDKFKEFNDIIEEKIKYWKEDYRYLAEILERR